MANPTSDFPGAVHTAYDISLFTGSNLGQTAPTHTGVHGKMEQEITATQLKLGTGSGGVAASGEFFMGIGLGSSDWVQALSSQISFNTIPIRGSGIAFTASGTGNVIAFLDNSGNLNISGQYLTL